jgi:hypothetical protein
MGQNGDTVILPNGVTEQVQSGGAIQVQSGGSITIASGATITNNGTAVGLGRTGTVDWATTPVTATFTASSGVGYFCNTTAGVITVNLPAGVAGAIVSLADYAATWQTNNLTISPNGTDKIGSQNLNATLSTQGQSVTFVYVDSTQGWINTMDSTSNVRGVSFIAATGGTITTVDTDYKVHTFTGPGTFCISAGAGPLAVIDYTVVAGGGGGGPACHAGGGGAGGFRESYCATTSGTYTASPLASPISLPVSIQGYPITVGAGGSSTPLPANANGGHGSDSILSSITSTGGGGATTGDENPNRDGGSGGGMRSTCGASYQGSGNTPPVSPPQGNNGGAIPGGASGPAYGAGGGGGAGAVGGTGNTSVGGTGGAGVTTSITGAAVTRGGGGGGSAFCGTAGAGGSGGGGAGGRRSSTNAVPGTANTGGGGGGAERSTPSADGGNGGSGIVIIRYKFQ